MGVVPALVDVVRDRADCVGIPGGPVGHNHEGYGGEGSVKGASEDGVR
jgi:hypothetical protein